MKKKIVLSLCSCAAVFAVCISAALIYNKIAFDGLGVETNLLQRAALPILAIILTAVVCVRFILPRFECKSDDFENMNPQKGSVLFRCTDFGACLSLGLALSALVAAPLADNAAYVGLAALFGVLFGIFALIPVISKVGNAAAINDKTAVIFASAGIVLSVIPSLGIICALCLTALSAASIGRETLGKDKGTLVLALNILALILSVVFSLLFVLILL